MPVSRKRRSACVCFFRKRTGSSFSSQPLKAAYASRSVASWPHISSNNWSLFMRSIARREGGKAGYDRGLYRSTIAAWMPGKLDICRKCGEQKINIVNLCQWYNFFCFLVLCTGPLWLGAYAPKRKLLGIVGGKRSSSLGCRTPSSNMVLTGRCSGPGGGRGPMWWSTPCWPGVHHGTTGCTLCAPGVG